MINHYAYYTIGQLIFTEGSSKSGKLITAYFKDSWWSKDTANADNTDNFFGVHYEMNKQDSNKVMFHVEAPPKDFNVDLNLIKRFLILSITADILSVNSQIKTSLDPLCCKTEPGRNNKSYNNSNINHTPVNIETNISTTVFKIQFTKPIIPNLTYDPDVFKLPNDERLDFELKIKEVHRSLANIIDKFLFPFIPLLSIH